MFTVKCLYLAPLVELPNTKVELSTSRALEGSGFGTRTGMHGALRDVGVNVFCDTIQKVVKYLAAFWHAVGFLEWRPCYAGTGVPWGLKVQLQRSLRHREEAARTAKRETYLSWLLLSHMPSSLSLWTGQILRD